MRGKLLFAAGAAVGFVMGARAGREKYEQIATKAREMWDHPTVQEAAGVVQAQANRLYQESKDQVTDKLSHTRLGEKLTPGTQDALAGSTVGSPSTKSTGNSSGF